MSINCDVYLINYKPLVDRLAFMKKQLDEKGITYEVISDEPNPSLGWARDDAEIRNKKTSPITSAKMKRMTEAEISLAWKHLIFFNIASSSKRKSLALEDDAILSEDFVDVINEILLDDSWDAVFPGSGCNLRCEGSGLIKVPHPASKCSDSYLVTPNAASKLYLSLKDNIDLAIDWELNYQMMYHNFSVCWYEPPIVRQGSQNGTFKSTVNG
jgi:GR25 family glycosyltransferase involved in LPS biosynthesis